MTTAIFLDIDGVLNNLYTTVTIPGRKIIGVEDAMLERLRKIRDLSDETVIVLTSTWKEAWEPEQGYGGTVHGEEGVYLDERLGEYGMKITAKTEDEWAERGAGILRYLEEHPEISRFVILDDYSFDFREQGLLPFWVRTDFEEETGGLQEKHVKQAARILKLQDHGIFCVKEILARKKKKKGGWLSRLLTGGNGKND